MADKINVAEVIDLEGELLNSASYAAYFNRIPLFTELKISNTGEVPVNSLILRITGSTPLILPQEIRVEEVPPESSVNLSAGDILNPKYLSDLAVSEVCTVGIKLVCARDVICTLEASVTALPLDCWSGLSGMTEALSTFVRPRMPDCQKILAEAGLQLKTWGYSSEWAGYSGNDKSAVQGAVAAIYSAIRRQEVEREGNCDLSGVVSTGDLTAIFREKRASVISMALLAASCLEAAGVNPVLVLGKNKIGVGVWLHESCFSSPVQDDLSIISRYITEGVNNLAVFDADDLFSHKNASYATSCGHFAQALEEGKFEVCLDIKRCRAGGFFPLPIKVKTASGYELLSDKQFSYDERPKELFDSSAFEYSAPASRERTWQRRLLDLSLKNNLLNFRFRRDAAHVLSNDLSSFCEKLSERDKFALVPVGSPIKDAAYFGGCPALRNMSDLISIELKGGAMRTYESADALSEISQNLIRKARSAEEEAGADTLCLAAGFLGWKYSGEKEEKFAPLALMPVQLRRTKSQGVLLETGEGFVINATLLEFLNREFGLDMRGAEDKGLAPSEILKLFRSKTADMKGWKVYEDVYLAQFTFARYAMWADVKRNIKKYSSNPIIKSLESNRNELTENKLSAAGEDECDPASVIVPLPCDSAQFSAVAESARGTTFVLHGPPGTGKSQTIANIIANALSAGKRVLFVAEKQAALQVVKKRLTEVGVGEFCLELNPGKSADKAEVIRTIETALALTDGEECDFAATAAKVAEARSELNAPYAALHKKRRLGASVYEGILLYLQNKDAPDLLNIESAFYDSLTRAKLEEYEGLLLTVQAAAKECGGVYRSPFSGVELTFCGSGERISALCAAEIVQAELRHLKSYLGLITDCFNQKISSFTAKKLENLCAIAQTLYDGGLSVFFAVGEVRLNKFYNACLRYDSGVRQWLKEFKTLPDIDKYFDKIEFELDNWGQNYRSSKVILAVIKRINRCSKRPVPESEEAECVKRAYEIEKAKRDMLSVEELSSPFNGYGGINAKKREEFLKPFYALHALCAATFMDYNADSFNAVCCGAERLKPLLSGFTGAAKLFNNACENFKSVLKISEKEFEDCDLFEKYSSKCGALIDNIDLLPAWCKYKATCAKLNEAGLSFITDAVESGRISGRQILSSFRKNVYKNFIQTNIPADEYLSVFSAGVEDEAAAAFARLTDEFTELSRKKLRADLISRLPKQDTEGALALELMSFRRSIKGNARGLNLRTLFGEIPELLRVVSPCMIMSPIAVSQYLPPENGLFDLVIFDEASQIPTAEAIPALARGKSAIIVGDPRQMPPTTFFSALNGDDENPEAEDLESILDDCLALGLPEKHLIWHYRSKHESLIAFSNITYYSSKLCTYPSPDAQVSKVSLRYIEDGVYERGGSKYNRKEAEALVAEIIRRLKDERLRKSSIGVVTFSVHQQACVEKMLAKEISKYSLEEYAYDREEPLFIKNLENVQGDERDVILFSVCYGPDDKGKLSLNFGPLNQFGGWRRLNVAASRAREEMIVFSSMRYSLIDLNRTSSRGVAGLKAFLEFAEKGRTSVAADSADVVATREGIGKYVAEELSACGYDCRVAVGVSDFKIDVAVIDPSDKRSFILAVLIDSPRNFSVKDRFVLQPRTLKRNNWNVYKLYSVTFFNNPKREVKKIKELLDRLCDGGKKVATGYKKPYKTAKAEVTLRDAAYILSGENDGEITSVIKSVVAAEEPISERFLIKRVLSLFGITKRGVKTESKIISLIGGCAFKKVTMCGNDYYYKTDKALSFERYRTEEGTALRSADADFSPYDVISAMRHILLNRVSVYADELIYAALRELGAPRATEKLVFFASQCIDEGVKAGVLSRSISDKISLA